MDKKGRQAFLNKLLTLSAYVFFFDLLGAWDKTEPASFFAVDDELGFVNTLLASFAIFGDV